MPKLPVTIFTGFLGSGKTTLLASLLAAEHGLVRCLGGVVVHEVGEVGPSRHLVQRFDTELAHARSPRTRRVLKRNHRESAGSSRTVGVRRGFRPFRLGTESEERVSAASGLTLHLITSG